jgi:hypothetical protein
MQELFPDDASARHAFHQWILQQLAEDSMFTANVSFTDEFLSLGVEAHNDSQ